MDRSLSTLLDALRFIAAVAVFVHHAEQITGDPYLSYPASFGHDAVIFFFLLSGFVIGYVSDKKEKYISDYFIARAARIYSVAAPAVALTGGLWFVATHLNIDHASYNNQPDFLKIIAGSALFLNHSWGIGQDFPTLGPYWSINYEVWYYVIFGLYFYLRGPARIIAIAAAMLLAGAKILILFPLWIAGYLCYLFYKKNYSAPTFLAVSILVLSLGSYAALRVLNIDDALYEYTRMKFGQEDLMNQQFAYSKRFLPDFIIGTIFIGIMFGLLHLRNTLVPRSLSFELIVKKLSSLTFPLYLFHYPLLVFLDAMDCSTGVSMAATLAVVFIFGKPVEKIKSIMQSMLHRIYQNRGPKGRIQK